VVLPGSVFACRGNPGRRNGRACGRQAQVLQDLLHDLLLGHEGEHDTTAATGTEEHVLAEDAQQKLRPRNARRAAGRWGFAVARSSPAASVTAGAMSSDRCGAEVHGCAPAALSGNGGMI